MLPPKHDVNQTNSMLTQEYGTASCIKSHVNKLSVMSAITSTQQRLKHYNRIPTNGLVVFSGEVIDDNGKPKKLTIDFEPFKPISTKMYLCDNRFHCEHLAELLEADDKFGFLIMDGNGALYGTVTGNHRDVIHKFSVELPKKHGRGGQSALRFARLRLEKRHNYVNKVAEIAKQLFITNDRVNVVGLFVAGCGELKFDLIRSDALDPRLESVLLKPVLDIAYGGDSGFYHAIQLASETLKDVKLVQV